MDRKTVFNVICGAIAEIFGVSENEITEEMYFEDDLDADMYDMMELAMIAEEELDLEELTEDEIIDVDTVGEAVELIMGKLG